MGSQKIEAARWRPKREAKKWMPKNGCQTNGCGEVGIHVFFEKYFFEKKVVGELWGLAS